MPKKKFELSKSQVDAIVFDNIFRLIWSKQGLGNDCDPLLWGVFDDASDRSVLDDETIATECRKAIKRVKARIVALRDCSC